MSPRTGRKISKQRKLQWESCRDEAKKRRGGVCEHDQEIISPCFINKKHPLSISFLATLFILSPLCDPRYYLVFGHSHPCALIKGDPTRRFCAVFFVHRGDVALEYWVNIKGAGCE